MTKQKTFRLEAEHFTSFHNFKKNMDLSASGGGFIAPKVSTTGVATSRFEGDSGLYDVVVRYFDENDGASQFVFRAGRHVEQFRFTDKSGSSNPDARSAETRVVLSDVKLERGDLLQLIVRADGRETGAIDSIEFVPKAQGEPSPAASPGFAETVLALTNQIRRDAGLAPLRFDEKLAKAALGHARDMAEHDFFGHVGSDGDHLGARVAETGYKSRALGENIAAGQDTPKDVMKAWMESAGHRQNILTARFDEVGVALVDDKDSNYGQYWVQVFADEI